VIVHLALLEFLRWPSSKAIRLRPKPPWWFAQLLLIATQWGKRCSIGRRPGRLRSCRCQGRQSVPGYLLQPVHRTSADNAASNLRAVLSGFSSQPWSGLLDLSDGLAGPPRDLAEARRAGPAQAWALTLAGPCCWWRRTDIGSYVDWPPSRPASLLPDFAGKDD